MGTLAKLIAHERDAILADWEARARRADIGGDEPEIELLDEMPSFLDRLVETLNGKSHPSRAERVAAGHGVHRLRQQFRIDEVVREYGLLGESVIAAAARVGVVPRAGELDTLFRMLNSGAATAAAEHSRLREAELQQQSAAHAGFLAHELRNSLASARFAFELVRRRHASKDDQLLDLVTRALAQAAQQVDDTLVGLRLRAGAPVERVPLSLATLLGAIVEETRAQADERGVTVHLDSAARLTVPGDERLIRSALGNLHRNALKFTRAGGEVWLRAYPRNGHAVVEVEDQCGGLPPGSAERIFTPFTQAGGDRTGFGLGLGIARAAAEAHGGSLDVRDLPGRGCVFTLALPRQ